MRTETSGIRRMLFRIYFGPIRTKVKSMEYSYKWVEDNKKNILLVSFSSLIIHHIILIAMGQALFESLVFLAFGALMF